MWYIYWFTTQTEGTAFKNNQVSSYSAPTNNLSIDFDNLRYRIDSRMSSGSALFKPDSIYELKKPLWGEYEPWRAFITHINQGFIQRHNESD